MSVRKRGLSKEELEVQRVLSPSSQGTQSGGVTPGQTGITIHADPPQAPVSLSDECIDKFARVMSRSVARAVEEEFHKRDMYDEYGDYDDEYDDDYEGTDRATNDGDDALQIENNVPQSSNPLSLLGIGANTNTGENINPEPIPPPVEANVNIVEIDPLMPQARRSRPPVNWHPKESILVWAADVIDGLEMTDEDRQAVVKKFSPDPKWDHLFTPVSPPEGMKKAMDHSETKKLDYLFNRAGAEEDF